MVTRRPLVISLLPRLVLGLLDRSLDFVSVFGEKLVTVEARL
jgi:hypothetical protein